MAEPGTRVWVAQRDGNSVPESLICCQPRGDALWVWGARTLAAARGCGLGALLLVSANGWGGWEAGQPRRCRLLVFGYTAAAYPSGPMTPRCLHHPLTPTLPPRSLQAHTEAHARQEHPSLRWLLSTTILANTAMLRLFERQGWRTLCEVDIFPRWDF